VEEEDLAELAVAVEDVEGAEGRGGILVIVEVENEVEDEGTALGLGRLKGTEMEVGRPTKRPKEPSSPVPNLVLIFGAMPAPSPTPGTMIKPEPPGSKALRSRFCNTEARRLMELEDGEEEEEVDGDEEDEEGERDSMGMASSSLGYESGNSSCRSGEGM